MPPAVLSVGGVSLGGDAGHEMTTSLLPTLLTSTLPTGRAPLGAIGMAVTVWQEGTATDCRLDVARAALMDVCRNSPAHVGACGVHPWGAGSLQSLVLGATSRTITQFPRPLRRS
jgi:hypothetical protein